MTFVQAYVPLASVLLLRTCKNPVKEGLGVTLILAVHVAPHTVRALLLSTTCYSMHCCHIENTSTLMDYFVHTEDTQCITGRMYIVRIMVNSRTSLSHFHSKHTPREAAVIQCKSCIVMASKIEVQLNHSETKHKALSLTFSGRPSTATSR